MNFSQKNSIVLCTFIYFFFSFPLDFSSILSALCLQFFLLFFFIVFFFLSHIWAFDFFFFFLLRKKRLFIFLFILTNCFALFVQMILFVLCFSGFSFIWLFLVLLTFLYIAFHVSHLIPYISYFRMLFTFLKWLNLFPYYCSTLFRFALPFFSRPISYFIFYAFSWSTSILCFNLILIYLSTLLLHSSYILFYMVYINVILRFNAFRKNKKLQ